jgi:hypothetical protein
MNKLLIILLLLHQGAIAQPSNYIAVHFLYGSVPKKQFKQTENKWWGGLYGGHVGVGIDSNTILHFLPKGKFHYIAINNNKHSQFNIDDFKSFYSVFGGNADSNKKTIVYIPADSIALQKFKNIQQAYLKYSPYDYAFLGMRCAAAARDVLGATSILPKRQTWYIGSRYFVPIFFRTKILRLAKKNKWPVYKCKGGTKRKWEKDNWL